MEKLNSKSRNILRKQAHELNPVVMIGKNGVTPELEAAVDATLSDHELIKVRFLDFKENRKKLTAEIAAKLDAAVVSVIGNIAILYRENPDKE